MRRSLWLAPLAVAIAAALVRLPAPWVEARYSTGAYLALQHRLTSWSNAIPVAVTDLILAGALLAAIGVTVGVWRRRKPAGHWRAAATLIRIATVASASIYVLFMAVWGLNYEREPLWRRLDFDRGRVTPATTTEFARGVVERVNDLHARAHGDGWPSWEALPEVLGASFERVQRQLADAPPAIPGVPKWSILTFYFERAGVSGMTDPFALEVVVDRSQLAFERPFVAAHEWAHLAGYAGEDEANFLGWLVCLQGPPGPAYSGNLDLLVSVLGAVPASERGALLRSLADGPRRDLQAMRERAARRWPWLQRPAWWLYDRYLRANRVEQGIVSYGAALDLIVGTRFGSGWVPGRSRKAEAGR
jgi:hypothetical protein